MTSPPQSRFQFGLPALFAATLAAAVVIFYAVSAYKAWHFAAIGAQAQRIEIGMTQAEVVERLGRPPEKIEGSTWVDFWGEVVIHFDEEGRVSQVDLSPPLAR